MPPLPRTLLLMMGFCVQYIDAAAIPGTRSIGPAFDNSNIPDNPPPGGPQSGKVVLPVFGSGGDGQQTTGEDTELEAPAATGTRRRGSTFDNRHDPDKSPSGGHQSGKVDLPVFGPGGDGQTIGEDNEPETPAAGSEDVERPATVKDQVPSDNSRDVQEGGVRVIVLAVVGLIVLAAVQVLICYSASLKQYMAPVVRGCSRCRMRCDILKRSANQFLGICKWSSTK